jgi:hypothetical protein
MKSQVKRGVEWMPLFSLLVSQNPKVDRLTADDETAGQRLVAIFPTL